MPINSFHKPLSKITSKSKTSMSIRSKKTSQKFSRKFSTTSLNTSINKKKSRPRVPKNIVVKQKKLIDYELPKSPEMIAEDDIIN
jgi:hypothetical protein